MIVLTEWLLAGTQIVRLSVRVWVEIARWPIVTTILAGIQATRVLLYR